MVALDVNTALLLSDGKFHFALKILHFSLASLAWWWCRASLSPCSGETSTFGPGNLTKLAWELAVGGGGAVLCQGIRVGAKVGSLSHSVNPSLSSFFHPLDSGPALRQSKMSIPFCRFLLSLIFYNHFHQTRSQAASVSHSYLRTRLINQKRMKG